MVNKDEFYEHNKYFDNSLIKNGDIEIEIKSNNSDNSIVIKTFLTDTIFAFKLDHETVITIYYNTSNNLYCMSNEEYNVESCVDGNMPNKEFIAYLGLYRAMENMYHLLEISTETDPTTLQLKTKYSKIKILF